MTPPIQDSHQAIDGATPAEPLSSSSASVAETSTHGQRGVITTQAVDPGGLVATLIVERTDREASRYSIQQDEQRHIVVASPLRLMNHSCQPNCFLDVEALTVLALRPLAAGEELTFFYPSTEWEMAEPFDCHCGAPGCLHSIRGARELTREELAPSPLAPHIQRLLLARS